jgi:hypothetical protein
MSFERGNKFLEEKKYDEAIEEYKKAIGSQFLNGPNNIWDWYYLKRSMKEAFEE